ncbi:MAG: response regulator [Candidatus Cloacimonetes bacterium]|nr:response regulator [Candidatus Cloacimonadota bacterium]
MEEKIKLLIVENEGIIAHYLKLELELEGFDVVGFVASGEEAVKLAAFHLPDIVLMDIKLAGKIDGITAADIISENLQIPIIFMTGYSRFEITQRAKELNPLVFFDKPVSVEVIKSLILDYFKT